MSTYWYFECLDHSPPLGAEEEFTQHTEDRHFARAIELAANRPVERDDRYWTLRTGSDEERSDSYFSMNARKFLHYHPTCQLGLVNEYGEHREMPIPTTEGVTRDPVRLPTLPAPRTLGGLPTVRQDEQDPAMNAGQTPNHGNGSEA